MIVIWIVCKPRILIIDVLMKKPFVNSAIIGLSNGHICDINFIKTIEGRVKIFVCKRNSESQNAFLASNYPNIMHIPHDIKHALIK